MPSCFEYVSCSLLLLRVVILSYCIFMMWLYVNDSLIGEFTSEDCVMVMSVVWRDGFPLVVQ